MRNWIFVVTLALAPSLAHADPVQLDGGQIDHGVVVQAHLGSQLVTIASSVPGTNFFSTIGSLQGGIFGGYKIKRVIFGLGFDLSRVATGASTSGSNQTTSSATTTIAFVPGVSVAIVRSADQRVELFAQFDLGFGTTVGDAVANGESIFRLNYDLGPGLRFWAHPQFAFGALAGLAGAFSWDTRAANGGVPSMTSSSGLTSIFAQLQVMGVF